MSPTATIRLRTLQSAPLDTWIALSEDESRIVATGKNYAEVSAKSDESGEQDVIILKTPAAWASFSV